MTSRAVLYTRPGCHLCEVMAGHLQPLLQARDLQLETVNIDTDPALKQRFGLRIPVFTLDDEIVCEGRMDDAAARDALGLT